jgi:chorismate mutase
MKKRPESIARWRSKIDSVDRELVRLLNQRARLALTVAGLKQRKGLPIRDHRREEEILIRVRRLNRGPMAGLQVANAFHSIIRESRRLESTAISAGQEMSRRCMVGWEMERFSQSAARLSTSVVHVEALSSACSKSHGSLMRSRSTGSSMKSIRSISSTAAWTSGSETGSTVITNESRSLLMLDS